MKRRLLVICFSFLYLCLNGQDKNRDEEYHLEIKSKYESNRSLIDNGFLDIYTVFENDSLNKPKFLIYVLNSIIPIETKEYEFNKESAQKIISDIGCNILTVQKATHNGYNGFEIEIDFKNKNKEVLGYLFVFLEENIHLHRILFMFPNRQYRKMFYPETMEILDSYSLIN